MKILPLVAIFFMLTGLSCALSSKQSKSQIAFDKVCENEKNSSLKAGRPSVKKVWKVINKKYNKASYKGRKLVVFMDGTGNDKSSNTNIWKLYKLSVQHACSGNNPVIPYYDKGVGAKWYNKFRGGGLGQGANKNIQQAYRFLVNTYEENDQIFILGFSRGAFTARSLNGMLEHVGLLKKNLFKSSLFIFDSPVETLYKAYNIHHDGTPSFLEGTLKEKILNAKEELGFKNITYKVLVSAIGVFDTVAALGVSFDDEPDNHRIDLYAEKGFHLMSLDEQRKIFRLSRFNTVNVKKDQHLEEIWLPGVHSNIGGGYNLQNGLSKISLDLMISKFVNYKIFPDMSEKSCKAEKQPCESGELKDAFFDQEKLWGKLGIHRRWPREYDYIHESVFIRKDIHILPHPHENREPLSKYKTPNLKGKEHYQIVSNCYTKKKEHDEHNYCYFCQFCKARQTLRCRQEDKYSTVDQTSFRYTWR